ncbi:unnamed protein product [Spirodela intermedia]|uniref:DWD hypersensitive to UV-B 1 N-terminal domain-containing protein n=1 Tax=Spirodela intermedia TaxID=51605 RepID=A0A7I8K962_SPIIN|nr:unnamed protein product [Spirodela intermedia]
MFPIISSLATAKLSHTAVYLDACRNLEVLPNTSILSSLSKAELKKSRLEVCNLEITLDLLVHYDLPPLIEALSQTKLSGIDAVDVCQESCGALPNGEEVRALIDAVNKKLRFANLSAFNKDVLRYVSRRGLNCEILDLRFSPIRTLSMAGDFMRLHTLNLDFSASLSSIKEGCFSCMPNLKRLSMCGTQIAELCLTSAILSKLPSLVELRFQIFLSHDDTRLFSTSYCVDAEVYDGRSVSTSESSRSATEPSDESELVFSGYKEFRTTWVESLSNNLSEMYNQTRHLSSLSSPLRSIPAQPFEEHIPVELLKGEKGYSIHPSDATPEKLISYHPSPICFEKHYREFMISSLPRLNVLDNVPIGDLGKEKSKITFSQHYEYLPYNRRHRESVVSILQKRETGTTIVFQSSRGSRTHSSRPFVDSFSRSLSAAKFGSNPWPRASTLSKVKRIINDESTSFRPRQFEYHPSDPSLMVFGTLDGELVAVNHESGKLVSILPSPGGASSILGLCWLKNHPSKLIAGSDRGALQLYDVHKMRAKFTDRCCRMDDRSFHELEQLTSVHVNSTDEYFIASGYSNHVALYDISSGRRLQIFKDLHREHINVVKFANHSPTVFASASFDRQVKLWDLRQEMSRPCYTAASSRGNVMVCFSDDDHYLLSSAIDNEVKQLLAVDGRLHTSLKISPTGSAQNYTRSYYMNGRDYIISGSCEENVVRICCAQTGRRLRDVSLEGRGKRSSVFVQSLRGDPFRPFHMSVLVAYSHPSSKSEIMKINLVESGDPLDGSSCSRDQRCSYGMGG